MGQTRTERFIGEIAGFGTRSGHRFVIGRWVDSPFGAFADVMHETPDGHRTLRAPSPPIAEFVASTYEFDDVVIQPIGVERTLKSVSVRTGDLHITLELGARTMLGNVLHVLPARITSTPWWCALVDPIARLALDGVRTRGTAGNGRREWYGATDQHRLGAARVELAGTRLGPIEEVWPPVRFGFSSVPRRPSIVSVTTTVRW